MEKTETFAKFHEEILGQEIKHLTPDQLQFNILAFRDCSSNINVIPYRKRDYYKVTFLKGNHIVHFSDKSFEVSGSTLAFFNPDIPYTVDMQNSDSDGFYFIFKESYLNNYYRRSIKELPLFAQDYKPLYVLNQEQERKVSRIFKQIKKEFSSSYEYKHDLIRNCILELIHLALKIKPSDKLYQAIDGNTRIKYVFNELLAMQFPVGSPLEPMKLRSAADFADGLSIHVNHLNRALKITTGKSTTELILQRIAEEGKYMLKYNNWTVSEIAYSLGFKSAASFNHFFKKECGQTPSEIRNIQ